ncbi:uncharacterized protein LOC113229012 [Hyposmocoma kahamanoa]|uniref:uncharacterized protein LOC113229012 n=1 Tax=Hyposmocoma kahamanoa TaxID=1477025 RepID=UPI000E6D7C46|nr:uncharacterized protein LOC113229012 [Hyposmocoma kahamanoa]
MPESPSYLAAHGDLEGARSALAWLRGTSAHATALDAEMETLPPLDDPKLSSLDVVKNLLSSAQRRRALIVSTLAVVGQEACGVFALLQFAERVFVLARDEVVADSAIAVAGREMLHATNVARATVTSGVNSTDLSNMTDVGGLWTLSEAPTQQSTLPSPARHAVVLGAVQLAASCFALYFVERIGRRPLIIMTGLATAACLGAGAGAIWLGTGVRADLWTTLALAGAVGFDSAGLQPAPYAVLADMFHYECPAGGEGRGVLQWRTTGDLENALKSSFSYPVTSQKSDPRCFAQYRGCAVMVATAAACAGNAAEVLVFPLVAAAGGVRAALALSAALTLLYVAFVAGLVPETRGRSPDEIYEELGPRAPPAAEHARGVSPRPAGDACVATHTHLTDEMTRL